MNLTEQMTPPADEKKWFVACVPAHKERKVAAQLERYGLQTFVAVQRVKKKWSDRIKDGDRMLFPKVVFVHCSEHGRRETFTMTADIKHYMMDRTSAVRRLLTVPEHQMIPFMRVVGVVHQKENLVIVGDHVRQGDRIRIMSGPLEGVVAECVEVQNKNRLIIRLGMLGNLLVSVDEAEVLKMPQP